MLAWMVYVCVVALFLGAAAYVAERSAQIRKAPTRWLWGVAIIASLVLPVVISSVSVQAPSLSSAVSGVSPAPVVVLRQMTSSALAPARWLDAAAGRAVASPGLDAILQWTWAAASVLIVGGIVLTSLQLHGRKRSWARGVMCGSEVFISEDVGPAVVGLLRPRIVVPRWIAEAGAERQDLVIAHERSHLEAGDARLLAIAVLLIVTMPWNLPLWWQLRRLRFAIEVDCDTRVLGSGRDVARYGETLIAVGERRSARVAVVAAMSESRSFLEERLRKMVSKRKKFAWASATALASMAIVLAASAAEVSPPNAEAPALHKEIAVGARVLDGYVGAYLMGQRAVFTVTREGEQLSAQLTGQPSIPIYPESRTRFFYKAVNAQLDFQVDASGRATSVVLHQAGRDITLPRTDPAKAQQIAGALAARQKSQTPAPGSEEAARRLDTSLAAGAPSYDVMTPELAAVTRSQLPKLQTYLASLGAVKSVRFLGVGGQGQDVFNIYHDNGVSHWTIVLDDNGKVAGAMVTPGP
jgi:beta-lactamase regulating signal transducer with metallopeptidase domain